jgi:hypothetical protein
MASRRVEVKRIAINKPHTFLDVSVSFRDGNSPFSRDNAVRGFYVNVSYVEVRDGMDFQLLGRGGSGLLESAPRFNQRRMNQLADAARFPGNAGLEAIIQRVLDRNGLALAEELEVACGAA